MTLEHLRGTCLSLRFSPDGRTLAAGPYLGTEPYMSLWQVPSFEEIDAAEATLKTREQAAMIPAREKSAVYLGAEDAG